MKPSMAYIDDSQSNLDCIRLIMQEDFTVETFSDPLEFLRKYPASPYNTIMVDIHMPKMDGFTLYSKIIEHSHYNGSPIFFISSDDSDESRIKSFSLGAVDFLHRRLSSVEMLTRVLTKIAFFQKHRSVFEFGNLKLNMTLLKTYLGEDELKLTFIEFKIMTHILKSYPEMITKEDLTEKIWGSGFVVDATLHTHISNLNAKLGNWDHEVVTERNRGITLLKKSDPSR